MIKVTFEFETRDEAAAFLGGAEDTPAKKKRKAPSAADLMGDGEEAEEEEEEEKPVTMKTIQPVLEKVANAGKGEEAKKLMKKLGATGGASTLPKAKYKAFLEGLKKIDLED